MLNNVTIKSGLLSLLILLTSMTAAIASEVFRMTVKENKASCVGVAPMQCFLVKYKASKDWELFYEGIRGFKYQDGYRYTIDVIRTKRKNAPADASLYIYTLKRIIKKQKISGTQVLKNSLQAIADKEWVLNTLNGTAVGSTNVKLSLNAKTFRFSGSGGCNSIFGTFKYQEKGSLITFGDAASTLMACADEKANQLESAYTAALSGKTFRVEATANTLVLYQGTIKVMVFGKPEVNGTSANEENIWKYIGKYSWKLIQLNGETLTASPVTLSFDVKTHRFNGNSGCNNYFGTYQVESDKLVFGPAASTRKACLDENLSRLEHRYLELISKKTLRYDVADQTLNFYDQDRLILMFGVIR